MSPDHWSKLTWDCIRRGLWPLWSNRLLGPETRPCVQTESHSYSRQICLDKCNTFSLVNTLLFGEYIHVRWSILFSLMSQRVQQLVYVCAGCGLHICSYLCTSIPFFSLFIFFVITKVSVFCLHFCSIFPCNLLSSSVFPFLFIVYLLFICIVVIVHIFEVWWHTHLFIKKILHYLIISWCESIPMVSYYNTKQGSFSVSHYTIEHVQLCIYM